MSTLKSLKINTTPSEDTIATQIQRKIVGTTTDGATTERARILQNENTLKPVEKGETVRENNIKNQRVNAELLNTLISKKIESIDILKPTNTHSVTSKTKANLDPFTSALQTHTLSTLQLSVSICLSQCKL